LKSNHLGAQGTFNLTRVSQVLSHTLESLDGRVYIRAFGQAAGFEQHATLLVEANAQAQVFILGCIYISYIDIDIDIAIDRKISAPSARRRDSSNTRRCSLRPTPKRRFSYFNIYIYNIYIYIYIYIARRRDPSSTRRCSSRPTPRRRSSY